MTFKLQCSQCGRETNALFRANPKGQNGIWVCEEHAPKPIDPVVHEIVTTIAKGK
jgi:hypothetical protein